MERRLLRCGGLGFESGVPTKRLSAFASTCGRCLPRNTSSERVCRLRLRSPSAHPTVLSNSAIRSGCTTVRGRQNESRYYPQENPNPILSPFSRQHVTGEAPQPDVGVSDIMQTVFRHGQAVLKQTECPALPSSSRSTKADLRLDAIRDFP